MNRFFSLHAVVAAVTLFSATSLMAADGPTKTNSGSKASQSMKAGQRMNLGDTATHERMGKLKTGTTVAPSAWYAKFDGIRRADTELRKRIDKSAPMRK